VNRAIRTLLPLLLLLAIAFALRFTGLSWGLRHPVHIDERYFVGGTAAMIRAGDLDHREHRYPGLYFFLLVPGMKVLGATEMEGPRGYLFARAVSASFGVLNVILLFFIGRRLVGPWGGFSSALLLAVMPLDVMISHQVRPETALTTAAVLAIASFRRIGPDLRGDVLAGLTLGLGAALKYTAPFLLPSYCVYRFLAPGRRLRGACVAMGLMVLVSLACTPSAVLHPLRYFGQMRTVTDSYYVGYAGKGATVAAAEGEHTFLEHLAYYLRDGESALGLPATVLSLTGVALCLMAFPREWGPMLLHPLTTLLVMSTASLIFPRQILQAMPLLCLMAGVVMERIGAWRGWVALVVALIAAYTPFRASLSMTRALTRPTSEDLALDWIEGHLAPGSRILETRPEADIGERPGAAIGIDPRRYEVLRYAAHSSPERKLDLSLLVPRMALVITGREGGGSWSRDLRTVFRAPDDLALRSPMHPLHCGDADLTQARWSGSGFVSGSGPSWTSLGPMKGGEWIQADLGKVLPIGEVELLFGNRPEKRPPRVTLSTESEPGRFTEVPTANARPSLRELGALNLPPTQLLILQAAPVRGIRIEQQEAGDMPLVIAALRLGACEAAEE
jgi:hypothetical protein